ncbi:hypothetical protein KKB55_19610 [Myxococcota bacterium]|nr:hypothetical protein [Myxococcota bacterium]MBU1899955.1 hypothetical protein [Myxococcota bacterium]
MEEISRPNPCLVHLKPPKTTPQANRFEDAQEISIGGRSKAILGTFGFDFNANELNYFIYRLNTDKKLSQIDTIDYVNCCKSNDCGYGYVSSLIHGQGEYAVGSETFADGSAGIPIASAGGTINLKMMKRRNVQGWLAAVVTVTNSDKRQALSEMKLAEEAGIQEDTLPAQMQSIYNNNKIEIDGKGKGYIFRLGSGDMITENEFVRRYKQITGSDELDDINTRRNKLSTALYAGLTLLGLSTLYYGVQNTERYCEADDAWAESACQANADTPGAKPVPSSIVDEYYNPKAKITNELGYAMAIIGGLMSAGFGSVLITKALNGDGGIYDHHLSDADARLYTSRYNRAFLRKTAREIRRSAYIPEIAPVMMGSSGLGFGLSGRF